MNDFSIPDRPWVSEFLVLPSQGVIMSIPFSNCHACPCPFAFLPSPFLPVWRFSSVRTWDNSCTFLSQPLQIPFYNLHPCIRNECMEWFYPSSSFPPKSGHEKNTPCCARMARQRCSSYIKKHLLRHACDLSEVFVIPKICWFPCSSFLTLVCLV